MAAFRCYLSFFPSQTFMKAANTRAIGTSATLLGKKNFRKFPTYNKRGSIQYKRDLFKRGLAMHDLGVRPTGIRLERSEKSAKNFYRIPEMIPELIVPDLEGFKLKPYVSYRVADVVQSEFTAQDLFDACYADKVVKDFKSGKLDETGNPVEPSEDEKATPEERWIAARKTGSDIFG